MYIYICNTYMYYNDTIGWFQDKTASETTQGGVYSCMSYIA